MKRTNRIAFIIMKSLFFQKLIRSVNSFSSSSITQSGLSQPSSVHISSNAILNTKNKELIKSTASEVLRQKLMLLEIISPEDYKRPLDSFFNASVGSHFRHAVDHYKCILSENDSIYYDKRSRNTPIENDKQIAIDLIQQFMSIVPTLDLDRSLSVTFVGNDEKRALMDYQMNSNTARELSFVAHHSVHHLAMIKLMMLHLQYDLSDIQNVGKAFGTIIHEEEKEKEKGEEKEKEEEKRV
jgi:hypothetical protein